MSTIPIRKENGCTKLLETGAVGRVQDVQKRSARLLEQVTENLEILRLNPEI